MTKPWNTITGDMKADDAKLGKTYLGCIDEYAVKAEQEAVSIDD